MFWRLLFFRVRARHDRDKQPQDENREQADQCDDQNTLRFQATGHFLRSENASGENENGGGGEGEISCVHVISTSNFWVNQLAIEIVAV